VVREGHEGRLLFDQCRRRRLIPPRRSVMRGGRAKANARRKFFNLVRIKAPIAAEAVERIDALFVVERESNGVTPHDSLAF
jgi:hypothetical protein